MYLLNIQSIYQTEINGYFKAGQVTIRMFEFELDYWDRIEFSTKMLTYAMKC